MSKPFTRGAGSEDATDAPERPPESPSSEKPPGSKPPGDSPPAPTATELLTPNAWAIRKGTVRPTTDIDLLRGLEPHVAMHHAMADSFFGWTSDAYNYQAPHAPFVLTAADYDASLKTAADYPNVPLHPAGFPNRKS